MAPNITLRIEYDPIGQNKGGPKENAYYQRANGMPKMLKRARRVLER